MYNGEIQDEWLFLLSTIRSARTNVRVEKTTSIMPMLSSSKSVSGKSINERLEPGNYLKNYPAFTPLDVYSSLKITVLKVPSWVPLLGLNKCLLHLNSLRKNVSHWEYISYILLIFFLVKLLSLCKD